MMENHTLNLEDHNLMAHLLSDTVQLATDYQVLILNSALDPFVSDAAHQLSTGTFTLAEDNIAALQSAQAAIALLGSLASQRFQHIAFHQYPTRYPPSTMDVAVMNLLYQPSNAFIAYGLDAAQYALKPGGHLYIAGAKDRGILSVAKRMQERFGNAETLVISKGQRVIRSTQNSVAPRFIGDMAGSTELVSTVFASGKLDEGTQLLLEALEVHRTDEALDIGCGAGFIGTFIAERASKGMVTMVDASLAAVDAARTMIEQRGLTNIKVLASDGAQAVLSQKFDLVVTNPPFHLGGVQTTEIAARFIREAAQVLRPRGRFYLVANRFLKYEPVMRACFKTVEEVRGNARYKVLRCTQI
jgi:16S rRNA (guanine1207-N2)-methyltransferase